MGRSRSVLFLAETQSRNCSEGVNTGALPLFLFVCINVRIYRNKEPGRTGILMKASNPRLSFLHPVHMYFQIWIQETSLSVTNPLIRCPLCNSDSRLHGLELSITRDRQWFYKSASFFFFFLSFQQFLCFLFFFSLFYSYFSAYPGLHDPGGLGLCAQGKILF